MNDTIPKAEQWLRDHDAEVRAEGRREAVAEIHSSFDAFFAQLESTLLTQLDAVREMREKLMDKPATPAKRKRAKTVASEQQVTAVLGMFENLAEGELLTVHEINEKFGYKKGYAADACRQLVAQGWIKYHGTSGYSWIPEKEAERENGLRTGLDDGPEIE